MMYLKCAACGGLYDSKESVCPKDGCGRITPRIYWRDEDYRNEALLKEAH